MDGRKKSILIVILLVFCFIYLTVQGIQGAYESTIGGRADNTIAKWSIKVNNQEITDSTITSVPLSYTVTDLTNVRSGKVGPGVNISYPVQIDASGSDVAIKISFTITDKTIDSDKILTLTSVTSSDLTIVRTGASEYSAIIPKTLLNTTKTVTLNMTWVDTGTLVEYTNDLVADDFVEIDFKAIQYTGETLVPYSSS